MPHIVDTRQGVSVAVISHGFVALAVAHGRRPFGLPVAVHCVSTVDGFVLPRSFLSLSLSNTIPSY